MRPLSPCDFVYTNSLLTFIIFSLRHRVQIGSVARQASYPRVVWGSYRGEKGLERESDHSLTSSTKVKKG
jgi:hypothetical protein